MTGWLSDPKRKTPDVSIANPFRDGFVPMTERLDPLHEIEWRNILDVQFTTVGGLRRSIELDPTGCLAHVDRRIEAPLIADATRTNSMDAIIIVAMLTQYHQLTTVQIACMLGSTPKRAEESLSWLYRAGVVRRSEAPWEYTQIASSGTGMIWALNTTSPQFQEWLDRLTDMEYLLMTGNGPLTQNTKSSNSSTSIRHNLVAAEIVLRAMESCPGVLGGWGERATTVEAFLDEKRIHDSEIRANVGDVCLVTRSGEVIVLETSGTRSVDADSGPRLVNKMKAWAAIAAMTDTPLKVVLVNISPKLSFYRFAKRMEEAVSTMGRYFPSKSMQDKAAMSIFMADAYDWFPSPMSVSSGFTTLESWSPVTQKYHDLVPLDVSVQDNAVVINTAAAIHTPRWTISGDRWSKRRGVRAL